MTATRPARQDADAITVRDTEFGPEIVYDYGIQATVIGLTENDMDRTLAVLSARPGRIREPHVGGYTDRAGIDSRANSALLTIEAITTDYSIPSAVRLVLVAQRMASEPILTDTAPAAYTVREQAASYNHREKTARGADRRK